MDDAAEDAIRAAFELGKPCNSTTIPARATQILDDPTLGQDRVYASIKEMTERKALEAPADPWKDWQLL